MSNEFEKFEKILRYEDLNNYHFNEAKRICYGALTAIFLKACNDGADIPAELVADNEHQKNKHKSDDIHEKMKHGASKDNFSSDYLSNITEYKFNYETATLDDYEEVARRLNKFSICSGAREALFNIFSQELASRFIVYRDELENNHSLSL